MRSQLAGVRSPAISSGSLVLVPVGSLEQHGPHLPLDTDTAIATAVSKRVAELLPEMEVLVAPAVSYGASAAHQSFPGTTSIGPEVLEPMLTELARSLRTWCSRVVFVNAHTGNARALTGAVRVLQAEGHEVTWVACAPEGGDAHAGFTETSLMLHLQPWAVRRDLAEVGNTSPLATLLPALRAGGVAAVSPNGVLGDPIGASQRVGERLFHAMTTEVAACVRDGAREARGRLGTRQSVR